jgi:hypothetical protein
LGFITGGQQKSTLQQWAFTEANSCFYGSCNAAKTRSPHLLEASGVTIFNQVQIKEGVMAEIQWLHDMSVALARAKAERKPILLDFFNPG